MLIPVAYTWHTPSVQHYEHSLYLDDESQATDVDSNQPDVIQWIASRSTTIVSYCYVHPCITTDT